MACAYECLQDVEIERYKLNYSNPTKNEKIEKVHAIMIDDSSRKQKKRQEIPATSRRIHMCEMYDERQKCCFDDDKSRSQLKIPTTQQQKEEK